MLMAFADGELDEVEPRPGRARGRRGSGAAGPGSRCSSGCARGLRRITAPAAEEEVPERLRALLETNVVAARRGARSARGRSGRASRRWPRRCVLGLALGRTLRGARRAGRRSRTARLVAQGALAEALDTQLASAQAARRGDPDRRHASRAPTGACAAPSRARRSPASPAASDGRLAAGDDRAPAPGQHGDYRQAGSGNALVLAAAQEMMAGEPLDAAAERRARDSGWRRSAGFPLVWPHGQPPAPLDPSPPRSAGSSRAC